MQATLGENLGMALSAVWTHRFRSLLTILGIVIGITTVIVVAALLTGLRQGIVDFFQEFGPDNVFIARLSGDPSGQFAPPKEQKRKPLQPEYADLIRKFAPSVEEVSVSLFSAPTPGRIPTAKVPGFESDNFQLNGYTATVFRVQPRELLMGRAFTDEEDKRAAKVCLIGPSLAEALFPDGSPLGRPINVDGVELTVIGVFAPAKGGFFGENGLDRQVMVPLETMRLRYPQANNFVLTAKAKPGLRNDAYEEIRSILRKVRQTPPGEDDDFALSTADQIIQNFDKITGMILLVSISLSALGLLVGGIGVMNIMLVSVTERTREIGVRKAIGARRFDIILQFLFEAVTLTALGGLLGILVAVLVTWLVSALVPALKASDVPGWAVLSGLMVSVAVGLFFGVWPAVKAARLDPVEALRYE
jgi:putative ABC transport system permease protein